MRAPIVKTCRAHSLLQLAARAIVILIAAAAGLMNQTTVDATIRHAAWTPDSLHAAAHAGDVDEVRRLIAAGADVDAKSEFGGTALMAAAERAHVEVVRLLLEAGADPSRADYLGNAPLHWAAVRGPAESVRLLITHGADVNAGSVQMGTPLSSAAGAGRIEIAALLLDRGATLQGGRRSLPPLAVATKSNHVEMIRLLIDRGASINGGSRPALLWAKEPEAARALLEAGADVNVRGDDGDTALHFSTGHWAPNEPSIRVLIIAGADIHARNDVGMTPLHSAVRAGRIDAVRLLIEAGADPNVKDQSNNTALSLARMHPRGDAMVELLEASGATDEGYTALQEAARSGKPDDVRKLLLEGAPVDERGPGGVTALHLASQRGDADIARVLIGASADVNAIDDRLHRPLNVATTADVVDALVDGGAEINAKRRELGDRSPAPPIETAALEGRSDVVAALVRRGAKLNGNPSPLVLATFAGHIQVVETLLDLGAPIQPKGNVVFEESALHVAASGAFADMTSPAPRDIRFRLVELLIDRGADVNLKIRRGFFDEATPLHGAAWDGNSEIVRLLIQNGSTVNVAPSSGRFAGFTPLHAAAMSDDLATIKLLVEHDGEINARTGESSFRGVKTPLDLAKSEEVRLWLRERGAVSADE